LSVSVLGRAQAQLDAYARRHGQAALEEAITAGQYTDASGLFYGGNQASWSRRELERIYSVFDLERRDKVIVIDWHTGLGPFGHGELISDHEPDSHGARLVKQLFGEAVTEPLLGTSVSVPKWGLMDYFWHDRLGQRGCFVTVEFGTYPIESIISVLRADHWLHVYSDLPSDDEQYTHIKQNMKRYFTPENTAWRELVLFRGRQVILQALTGICG
jgi:hypothetical protein